MSDHCHINHETGEGTAMGHVHSAPLRFTPESCESAIAHRWARAAFNLAHYGDRDPDAALLKKMVGEFWAPLDYTGDEDEIMRVAILMAVQEITE